MTHRNHSKGFIGDSCPGVAYYGDDDAFGVAVETRDGAMIKKRMHRQLAESLVRQVDYALKSYQPKTAMQVQLHDKVIISRAS
jgi:hypothetical protein